MDTNAYPKRTFYKCTHQLTSFPYNTEGYNSENNIKGITEVLNVSLFTKMVEKLLTIHDIQNYHFFFPFLFNNLLQVSKSVYPTKWKILDESGIGEIH